MKADEPILVYSGRPWPAKFTHFTYSSCPEPEHLWLAKQYGPFGVGFYASHGKIWFRNEKELMFFLLLHDTSKTTR